MRIYRRIAKEDQRERIQRNMAWCARHNETLDGYPFDDPLAGPAGIALEVYVPPGTDDHECERILRLATRERDVVSHACVQCPEDWFPDSMLRGIRGEEASFSASEDDGLSPG